MLPYSLKPTTPIPESFAPSPQSIAPPASSNIQWGKQKTLGWFYAKSPIPVCKGFFHCLFVPSMRKRKCEGATHCSNWDSGLVTVVPVSFAGVDSLDETRFYFLLRRPLHFETCCCLATLHISNSSPFTTTQIISTLFPYHINTGEKMRGMTNHPIH